MIIITLLAATPLKYIVVPCFLVNSFVKFRKFNVTLKVFVDVCDVQAVTLVMLHCFLKEIIESFKTQFTLPAIVTSKMVEIFLNSVLILITK